MVEDWRHCYAGSWTGKLAPGSMSHPAKVSFGLARRIYQHANDKGWLSEDSVILDPFAGIGGFAFHAMLNGHDFVGIEIEPNFANLARRNIELWTKLYKPHFPYYGMAKVIQGDSQYIDSTYFSDFDLCISSPPFEGITSDRPSKTIIKSGLRMGASSMGDGYGNTDGQLGAMAKDDFWTSAHMIMEQVYTVLNSGGRAIFVLKEFVRGGKLIPFPDQWQELCESVGFIVVCKHRAWLIEDKGTQFTLDGEAITKTTKRVSFFRRLAEKRGSPPIDYETVLCLQKI
jgi:tRNA G10  N-methylase Trm11